jgi:hypothetical protein
VEKEVIREEGQSTRVVRRHDLARTPFDRLCATDAILPEHREQLTALRDSINPRQLRQDISDRIKRIFDLPGAVPGITEDVHQTLTQNLSPEKGARHLLNFGFNRTTIRK